MTRVLLLVLALGTMITGCSGTYYNAMEKAGYHKRDTLVSRVEKARDSQEDAQEQFANTLKTDIDQLIVKMNTSIESSNRFIAEMGEES